MSTKTSEKTDHSLANDAIIEIIEMHKWFGDFHVLQGIDLTVRKKERIVICGPSGSGKSTLIRCINRLEEHQRGRIIVDGIELTDNIKNIEKVRTEVGMVFQQSKTSRWGPCGCERSPRLKQKKQPCFIWIRST